MENREFCDRQIVKMDKRFDLYKHPHLQMDSNPSFSVFSVS